jgi:hypothetical protein
MPYDASDLRSQLSSGGGGQRAAGAAVAPQYFVFPTMPPTETAAGGTKTWYVRSQTCCVSFSLAHAGDVLRRADQPDEYMILVHQPETSIVVAAGDEKQAVTGGAVVVVPPGPSEITVEQGGMIARIFSTRSEDLNAMCENAEFYAEPDPNVAPYEPWPDPPEGHRVRVYRLADVPTDPNRFGRLFRCSSVMVNYFFTADEPRDVHKLSPHHHDDFEQISLTLEGDYVHHIRTPWTVDMDDWRDDDHHYTPSPAVTVIPPPTVHTSQAVHHMPHTLIDVFSPPRMDFSERPGWVLNHDEYPMPDGSSPTA